jgi:PAS domain S-box-containing protein
MNQGKTGTADSAQEFLTGGGEVGALMRSHDWSSSPLGAPASWPQSLRTVVSLILNSKFPMFLAWGPQLGFLYNDPYAEVLGAKHPAALGRRFHDIWSEIWDDIDPLIRRALAGEASYRENLPLKMRRRGYDEQTWFTFSYSPVRDESGAVAGMYCTCTETTAQVLAERSRLREIERLRSLFEHAPSFIAVLRGPEHVFELTNKAYLQLAGHRNVIGKPVREAMPEIAGQGFFELLDRVYATGEPFIGHAVPARLQRQPGGAPEERFIDLIYQPIRDTAGTVTGIFVEGSDVTERKHAVDELQASDRRKDDFLAMLAHELRNPLAPISTAAELLRMQNLDKAGLWRASEIISRQVEHMVELVNDLLDVSRVTRGLITLEREALDLKAVIAGAVEQARTLIESRRHRLKLRMPGQSMPVLADRTRLVQVIVNLLTNAAKYTPAGGEILLQLSTEDGQADILVRDNGIGIAPDVLPHVFDLFTQAERTPDRSQGGLGLGLALVKTLAELHGGSVAARSEGQGRGSEFLVRLPLLDEDEPTGTHSLTGQTAQPASGGLRLMIVDDNADAARALALILQAQDHWVSVAFDAHAALEQVRSEQPQALLLDVGLPDMDGYELARRLRALPETAGALLIALTGYGQDHDRARSLAAGFDHHLVKPANLAQLTALLAHEAAARGDAGDRML